MALDTYKQKRNFKVTPEPPGSARRKPKGGNSFVIQKHDATRLHYDLRLEMDGVLVSWAVTRGPSLVPGEKRLAVHVEDHPLAYGDFEGTIPKGEYGGGTVIVWDRGTWAPVHDLAKSMRKGHLEFTLEGEKLHGRWHLVRMAGKPREKRENWLLIKSEDSFARAEDEPDILEESPDSVKTGRSIADVESEAPGRSSKTGKIERKAAPAAKGAKPAKAAKASAKSSAKADADPFPGFVPPALATLRPAPPAGKDWLHEIKFDGYRLQAQIEGGKVRLITRGNQDWTAKFGKKLSAAFAGLEAKTAIIDGELVVEASGGASDFAALQADLSAGRDDRFAFYAFDLLYRDGKDWRPAPLIERKAELKMLLEGCDPILRFSDHFNENGEMILRHACRLSLEGVISKRRDAPYPSGRSGDWIKSKCSDRQELVIGGYVPSSVSKTAIGSLVLGYYEDGKFVHAGRVGTGFSKQVAEDLFKRLDKLATKTSPFAEKLNGLAAQGVRYVKPELVADVEFSNWTPDGLLRHASFRGLREDKAAADVVREGKAKSSQGDRASAKRDRIAPEPKAARAVKLTHPDRVYWKDAGVTKEGLADYYTQAWPLMAPFVASRPLALLRCPQGTGSHCFFQKHSWKGQSPEILTFDDPLDDSDEPLVAIDSLDGLIGLVQGATLEIHPWQSALGALEAPDQIVMDLDPDEAVSWPRVIAAAEEVRQRLKDTGLESFVKTSGGKGLHIVAPLRPKAGWDAVKGFAKRIADAMAKDDPDAFVATVSKAKRKGKILVDYLRNGRGATAIAPYATRARDGAPVAMPLAWEELGEAIGPDYFTVANAGARIASIRSQQSADPWADFRKAEKPLPK